MTTQLPPDPEQTTPSRRFTLRSTRPALALGAVALSVFGLSQMTGTSAAFQDTAAATSGALTVSANVLPAVLSMSANNKGTAGTQWCELSWPHLGYPYIYRTEVYLNNSGSPVWTGDQDPGVNAPVGTTVTRGVGSDETTYSASTRTFTARVYTINRLTGEKSTDWRGQQIRRRGLYFEGTCDGADQSISGASLTVGIGALNAPAAPPSETGPATPTPTTQTTTPTTSTATPSTTTATPSKSPQPTTSTNAPMQSAAPTSATAPGTTTVPSTTTATATPTPTTMTTTAPADTPLGAPQRSPALGYSAQLVKPSGTSQTVILIEDVSGDEVKRIPVSASAIFEWDSSTDTLWIVDGGQIYQAAGSAWTKTAVDPSSDDVPAYVAALVE